MKATTVTLLLLMMFVTGCVQADDEAPGKFSTVANTDYQGHAQPTTVVKTPDTRRTVSYLSEKPWDGWEDSPERVKVTVRSAGDRHTHYFESLPVAYGWLPERYDDFDIVDMVIANALTGRDLLDTDNAFYLLSRGYGQSIPHVLAYPTRRDAVYMLDRDPDRYALADWVKLDRDLDDWRANSWDVWRDDFGFVRTRTVAHLDGTYWDGWYDTPDRVLVRMGGDGAFSSYYFDSLPVAWSFIDSRPSGFELLDLQVAAADGSLRLLPARDASFVWLPAGSDALPAVLAFGTRNEAANYLRALGDSGFRLADWDDLKPRLTSWSNEHWNTWRGNPEHNRGIARALESGLGRKLGLREREEGVVAGDHKLRERVKEDSGNLKKTGKAKSPGKSKPAGKSAKRSKDSAPSKGKAKDSGSSKSKAKVKGAGKSKSGSGASEKSSRGKGHSKAKGAERVKSSEGGRDKGKGSGGGHSKGSGKK